MAIKPNGNVINAESINPELKEPSFVEKEASGVEGGQASAPVNPQLEAAKAAIAENNAAVSAQVAPQHVPQVDLGMRSNAPGERAAPHPVVYGAANASQPAQIPGQQLDVAALQAQIAQLQAQLAQANGSNHIQAAAVAPGGAAGKPLHHAPYVSKSKGYPVQPGQTWHDLTPQQRNEWFANHENRWKQRFQAQNSSVQAMPSWTRG